MGPESILATGLMAAAFSAIHLLAGTLSVLHRVPRNRWLSFAGGIAVAYIFLHVLPELSAHQTTFAELLGLDPVAAESLVYGIALLGLAVFYGVERMAKTSRERSRMRGEGDRLQNGPLWIHVASFSVINLLIGYLLLHREETGAWSLGLYFVAMALHFLTSDFGMRQDHPQAYDRTGRWIIAAAVFGGWLLGVFVELHEVAIGLVFAFVAGGVVLNVLKEELPEERKSRFLPFFGGTALYAVLVIAERTIA